MRLNFSKIFWVRLLLVAFCVTRGAGEGDTQPRTQPRTGDKPPEPEEDYVLVLTKDNFDEAIAQHRHILVDFYAPACKHCRRLAFVYQKAAKLLNDAESPIKLAKVDATVERELAERYKIGSYPTVKFFRDGEPLDYKNIQEHEEGAIVAWLKKKTSPSAEVVETNERLQRLRHSFEVIVVGFFKNKESEALKDFLKVADEDDYLTYAVTHEPALFNIFNINKDSVIMLRAFDEERVDLEGEINTKTIEEFIDYNRIPYVVEFNPDIATFVMDSRVRRHLLYFISKQDERFEERIKTYRDVAPKFKKQVIFIYVNIDDPLFTRIMNWFYVTPEHAPTTRFVELDEPLKYRPDSVNWTADELTRFVQDVLDHKRPAFYVSEEIPEDWDSKPVKVLVGKNFDQVAKDPTKNVFVKFYAPWCGFCKELAPMWDALAERFKDDPDVMIAELDATANEIQGIRITIYPTMIFFPKGSSETIEFPNIKTTTEKLIYFVETGGQFLEETASGPGDTDPTKSSQDKNKDVRKEEL